MAKYCHLTEGFLIRFEKEMILYVELYKLLKSSQLRYRFQKVLEYKLSKLMDENGGL